MKWKKTAQALVMTLALVAAPVVAQAQDALTTVMSAGTTQAFSDEEVSMADLRTILEAGLKATSAINQQPWFFVAVTNKEVMNELSSGMGAPADMPADAPADFPAAPAEDETAPAASMTVKASLGDSPAAIIIYMDQSTASPNPDFDCGLACQNMVVAAASLGYGAKIISSPTHSLNGAEHDAICEKLGVDKSLQAVAVLLVGRADAQADAVSSASLRSALGEKVSFVE